MKFQGVELVITNEAGGIAWRAVRERKGIEAEDPKPARWSCSWLGARVDSPALLHPRDWRDALYTIDGGMTRRQSNHAMSVHHPQCWYLGSCSFVLSGSGNHRDQYARLMAVS